MQRVHQDEAGAELVPAPGREVGEVDEVAEAPGPPGPHGVELGHEAPQATAGQRRRVEPGGGHHQRGRWPPRRRCGPPRVCQPSGRSAGSSNVASPTRRPSIHCGSTRWSTCCDGTAPPPSSRLHPHLGGAAVRQVDPDPAGRPGRRDEDRGQRPPPAGAGAGRPGRRPPTPASTASTPERPQHRLDRVRRHVHVVAPPGPSTPWRPRRRRASRASSGRHRPVGRSSTGAVTTAGAGGACHGLRRLQLRGQGDQRRPRRRAGRPAARRSAARPSVQCSGTDIAGCPVTLYGAV